METAYRRRLWAYPKGPRRAELLGTLMESGHRPGVRETLNLLRCGLRARLGRPASRMVVVVALLIALCTGFFGAAIAGRLAFQAAPGLPTGDRLAEITGAVFPSTAIEQDPVPSGHFTDLDIEYGFTSHRFSPQPSSYVAGDFRAWTDETARRMSAAGWTVRGDYSLDSYRRLWVDRGDLSLVIEASSGAAGGHPEALIPTATLDRYQPRFVTAAAWLAFLPCALLGWLLTGWACRRTDHAGKDVRVPIAGLTGGSLFFLTPLALSGMSGLIRAGLHSDYQAGPFWSLSVGIGLGFTVFGLLSGVAALLMVHQGGKRPAMFRAR